jgi:hypothetical protein
MVGVSFRRIARCEDSSDGPIISGLVILTGLAADSTTAIGERH